MSLTPQLISAAQKAQETWNVWASVSLAQYGVESAWGRALSGRNNPFGIKALPGHSATARRTREVFGGRSVYIVDRFADFNSIDESFDEHAKLLATSHYYHEAVLHAYRSDDPSAERFIDGLHAYATDPNYRATLKRVCSTMGLYQYDTLGAAVPAAAAAFAPQAPHIPELKLDLL